MKTIPLKQTSKEITLLLGISILLGFIVNQLSPNRIELFGNWDTSKGVISANSVDQRIEIQSINQAKSIYNAKKTIFIDARSTELFNDEHIKGAISLPVDQFDTMIESFMEKYPETTSIVTYCSGRECEDSHNLGKLLIDFGYENTQVFIDGFSGWKGAAFPIE